ncbi:hypothetical protein E2C01_032694 [Portunus trituberculatus]|uniref:Uncharacterized protein n=1 Tax=Portunus trituberculatus TaxID=210409 RepID=A0A5B7F1Q9_PORTR|nr:hypothetical protein [Portunus trituberculatus]
MIVCTSYQEERHIVQSEVNQSASSQTVVVRFFPSSSPEYMDFSYSIQNCSQDFQDQEQGSSTPQGEPGVAVPKEQQQQQATCPTNLGSEVAGME